MNGFVPQTPIPLQIRRIIFERFNDVEARFTNDEIFEIIKKNGDVDSGWSIDDMEPFFEGICGGGLARNIAQNLTTIWFKLFEPVSALHCKACGFDVHLGAGEARACPNPRCGGAL